MTTLKTFFRNTPLRTLLAGLILATSTASVWATPLVDAVEAGDTARVKFLLEKKSADINEIDHHGIWPLLAAATDDNTAMLELLLRLKADPNRVDQYQYSALHEAASIGHHAALEILIDAGADINARDINNITPLGYAMRSPSQEAVSLLRSFGAIQ